MSAAGFGHVAGWKEWCTLVERAALATPASAADPDSIIISAGKLGQAASRPAKAGL
jgi:hypothetical protein